VKISAYLFALGSDVIAIKQWCSLNLWSRHILYSQFIIWILRVL
jgi:hypothetical protein